MKTYYNIANWLFVFFLGLMLLFIPASIVFESIDKKVSELGLIVYFYGRTFLFVAGFILICRLKAKGTNLVLWFMLSFFIVLLWLSLAVLIFHLDGGHVWHIAFPIYTFVWKAFLFFYFCISVAPIVSKELDKFTKDLRLYKPS